MTREHLKQKEIACISRFIQTVLSMLEEEENEWKNLTFINL